MPRHRPRRIALDLRGLIGRIDLLRLTGGVKRDPAGLLEGSGKRMRHVKLKPGSELDSAALRDLIDAAYLDIRARLVACTD
jgi:hypothetical protein